MRLPHNVQKLKELKLDRAALLAAIKERRDLIRSVRDAKGDDRCWVDFYYIYEMLDDFPDVPQLLSNMSLGEKMHECQRFWTMRNASVPDPIPGDALVFRSCWDSDLETMDDEGLLSELYRLQHQILKHREVLYKGKFSVRTSDDRELFRVLPEKMTADFRLPPRKDFLGEGKTPHAGCPSFWRSHEGCTTVCNFGTWGPCV